MDKNTLLNEYTKLAYKLGKLPSLKEVINFICSERQVGNNFGKFNILKQEALEKNPKLKELQVPAELNKVDIENYKLDLQKKSVDKKNKTLTKNVVTLEYIEKFADDVFKGKVTPHKIPVSKAKTNRSLILTLSDLHFGSDIESDETGYLTYGPVQEARRFAEVIRQTIEFKPQYRNETELHVNLLGDIIENHLHDPQHAATMTEQVCRAIHLLSQGLAQLGEHFSKVTVHCATGNHGRNTSRHKERASSGKWDSIETIIYYSVKKALENYSNIKFDIPKTPFSMYEVLGHKVFATHGDTVINPGNPGKSINIQRLENQINKINASLKDNDEVKLVFVGHTHCASVSDLSSGSALITNGCLPPVDPYAVSLGILENRSSQTLIESVQDYPLGDVRLIRVGLKQDNDKSLDKIVKPWSSLDE